MSIHFFGIRHHGVGCARSLQQAFETLQPDIILIEGPPEANDLLPLASLNSMQPPVAILIYAPLQPKHAVYYPFAVFSPEWQAIQFGQRANIVTRFIDLPQSHQLAESINVEKEWLDKQQLELERLKLEDQQSDQDQSLSITADNPDISEPHNEVLAEATELHSGDALKWLATAAGFSDVETWWDHLVEQREDSLDLFASIEKMMTVARSALNQTLSEREAKREAHMRQMIRAAEKEGFKKIAVICGAWHVPALQDMPSIKHDADLLKNLAKEKVTATWTPWTYGRLAQQSGYGAGIQAPGWYDHLWHRPKQAAMYWLTDIAQLLRKHDLDASSAHLIEILRLADTLASLRERSRAGLVELMDATQSILFGEHNSPLRLIEKDLLINDRLGTVPPETPLLPLPADVKRLQKNLRFKINTETQILELDLRQENHLEKSIFLHRLNLLGIAWGKIKNNYGKTGTYNETWQLEWQPEFELHLIEANIWGASVAEATYQKLCHDAEKTTRLNEITPLIECILLTNATSAIEPVMLRIQSLAATTHDASTLMTAIAPLAKVMRYGNVRKTNLDAVSAVLDGLIQRACIALPLAASGINQEAANQLMTAITAMDSAIHLLQQPEHTHAWFNALGKCARMQTTQALIAGRSVRILTEQAVWSVEETAQALAFACNNPINPLQTADWIEGFLQGSGLLLILNDMLFNIFNQWVASLSDSAFIELLPLLRRTFSTFTSAERQQLGQRANVDGSAQLINQSDDKQPIDALRAQRVLPLLGQIFAATHLTISEQ